MADFDVFNGDADGICALLQLRLAEPRESTLITGVKREISLLQRVNGMVGDRITALDISLDENREALQRVLAQGAEVTFVDHHFAGEIPVHPALHAVIETTPEVCTSLLVDRMLQGRFRIWAVVAAFGDNLPDCARHAAEPLRLAPAQLEMLRELGVYINYNAYGDSVEDLFFHPADLYRRLRAYANPFDFIGQETVFATLQQGYASDMAMAKALQPKHANPGGRIYIMSDQPWSRRVSGAFSNSLALHEASLAHAVLTPRSGGGYVVSVRVPRNTTTGADDFCRQFPSGGGRKTAAGINYLPDNQLDFFIARFDAAFQKS